MSVLIEGNSVIVRKSTIEHKYLGGLKRYIEDCPNRTFCSDVNLTVVMFQTPDDTYTWIRRLENHGLLYLKKGKYVDIALVDFKQGPRRKCNWLEFSEVRVHTISFNMDVKLLTCHLKGAEPNKSGLPSVPEEWSLAESLSAGSSYVSVEKVRDRYRFIDETDGIDLHRDKHSEINVSIGRPFGSHNEVQISYDLYQKGHELIEPFIRKEPLKDNNRKDNLNLGIQYLKDAVQLHPHNWVAHYYLGRAFENKKDYSRSHQHYEKAYDLNTDEPNVCRLFMESCSRLEKFQDALDVARSALRNWPREPEWIADYGTFLYLNGRIEKGKRLMKKSLSLNPDDEVTRDRLRFFNRNESCHSNN